MYDQGTLGEPVLVLRFSGELDSMGAAGLRRRLERAITGGAHGIVVDLTDVTFVESISLAALVAAKHRLAPRGRLAVVVENRFVGLMLEAAGLEGVLDVFPEMDPAREFAFGAGGERQAPVGA